MPAFLGFSERATAFYAELELNTRGDAASRQAYRAALVDYYSGHASGLSEDSRRRLERNPLRILDSKDEGDKRRERANAHGQRANRQDLLCRCEIPKFTPGTALLH